MERMHGKNILAVIPARAGSKGIPRKNMRMMSGKPLIEYSIRNALNSQYVTTVVVSSDSPEVLGFASQFEDVIVIHRNQDLSGDSITLDPVVYDAMTRCEEDLDQHYDVVITMQPTSPLLTTETLDSAIEGFLQSTADTSISVTNNPHLSWIEDDDGNIIPDYENRKNRQELPPHFIETGAFLISKRDHIKPTSRIGNSIAVFEVPEEEAVDIDTLSDWAACENALNQKRIAFRVDGYRELGMGHIYRVLTLAYQLTGHQITFLCSGEHPEGIELLTAANMKVIELKDEKHLFDWLRANNIDIFINDTLDTERDYVDKVKEYVPRFISFEDIGSGARHADAVINALYDRQAGQGDSFFCGEDYVCLRDEFLITEPKQFQEEVQRVFVMFGGSDPLDLTSRVYALAKRKNEHDIRYRFDFVLGLPYANSQIVDDPAHGITIHRDLVRVSDVMKEADLAFTSQGRSVFELASLGIPSIVMAQNTREQSHYFAEMSNGFINLGLGDKVTDDDLERTFDWLVCSPGIRREMHELMLKKNLKNGIRRVKHIILED